MPSWLRSPTESCVWFGMTISKGHVTVNEGAYGASWCVTALALTQGSGPTTGSVRLPKTKCSSKRPLTQCHMVKTDTSPGDHTLWIPLAGTLQKRICSTVLFFFDTRSSVHSTSPFDRGMVNLGILTTLGKSGHGGRQGFVARANLTTGWVWDLHMVDLCRLFCVLCMFFMTSFFEVCTWLLWLL
jgi:hypothetical protein